MEIVELKEEHIGECIAMRAELYPGLRNEYHEQELKLILKDDRFRDFICFIKEEPAALLELSFRNIVDNCLSSPVGYVEGIFIKEKFRGKNYGRNLLEFAEDFFRKNGCTEMASDAAIDNINSRKFHIACGFEETEKIVQFRKSI